MIGVTKIGASVLREVCTVYLLTLTALVTVPTARLVLAPNAQWDKRS